MNRTLLPVNAPRLLLPILLLAGEVCVAGPAPRTEAIVCSSDAPANVKLAAKEIRRYLFLRTGELLPIKESGRGISLRVDKGLMAEQYRLRGDGGALEISGGSDTAVLYGAYKLAETLGVRFYLYGDVIPDQ